MASYTIYRSGLIQLAVMAFLIPAVYTQCVQTLNSVGAIGQTAEFCICDSVKDGGGLTIQTDDEEDLVVPSESWTDGWYWEQFGSGSDSEIHILLTVQSVDVYGVTYVVTYMNRSYRTNMWSLTVSFQGPPQLCYEYVPILAAKIGSSGGSTACVASQDWTILTISTYSPSDCKVDTYNGSSTFDMTVVQDSDNTVAYYLSFEVANLSDADIGTWTVDITNADGILALDVIVVDNGPTLCVKDSSHDSQRLEGDLYDTVTSSVFIFTSDTLTQSNISVEKLTSDPSENSDIDSTFFVAPLQRNDSTQPQELVLQVTSLSLADVGNWTVFVNNTFGWTQFDVFVVASNAQCVEKTDSSGEIGEIVDFFICSPPSSSSTISVVGTEGAQFEVNQDSWLYGWYWEELSDGVSSYSHVRAEITSEANFTTTVVLLVVEGQPLNEVVELTIVHGLDVKGDGGDDSFNALALGVGLAALFIIIVLAAVIVYQCRQIRRQKETPLVTEALESLRSGEYAEYMIQSPGDIGLNSLDSRRQPARRSYIENAPTAARANGSVSVLSTPGEYLVADGGVPASQGKAKYVRNSGLDSGHKLARRSNYENAPAPPEKPATLNGFSPSSATPGEYLVADGGEPASLGKAKYVRNSDLDSGHKLARRSNYENVPAPAEKRATLNGSPPASATPGEYLVADGGDPKLLRRNYQTCGRNKQPVIADWKAQSTDDIQADVTEYSATADEAQPEVFTYSCADEPEDIPRMPRMSRPDLGRSRGLGMTLNSSLTPTNMTSEPYDSCTSRNVEPPNLYQRVVKADHVNKGCVTESEAAGETYATIGSTYENTTGHSSC